MMAQSYAAFIRDLARHSPSLAPLESHLSSAQTYNQSLGSLSLVEYRDNNATSIHGQTLQQALCKIQELKSMIPTPNCHAGLCIVVEDVHPVELAALGDALDVDPHFFREHAITNSFDKLPVTRAVPSLRSQRQSKHTAHFHYQRVIVLKPAHPEGLIPYRLRMLGNTPRGVKRLPELSGQLPALARACASMTIQDLDNDCWIGNDRHPSIMLWRVCQENFANAFAGLMLVDCATADVISHRTPGPWKAGDLTMKQTGHRDHCREPDVVPSYWSWRQQGLGSVASARPKTNLARDVSELLAKVDPRVLNEHNRLWRLSEAPIHIMIQEWAIYSWLMGRYMKCYEFSAAGLQQQTSQQMDDHIVELYRWRRRGQRSLEKLGYLSRFLGQRPDQDDVAVALIEDVEGLMSEIKQYGDSLAAMVPILTSTIQLVDSQRVAQEARHVKQLTYLALVFLPLSYIATLFSMSDSFAAEGPAFWKYWAVALPLLGGVLAFSYLMPRLGG